MPILDMKEFQNFKKEQIKKEVEKLKQIGIQPKLSIITDDKDNRTRTYMKSKLKYADELGIMAEKIVVDINNRKIISEIKTPVICQLPILKEVEDYYEYNLKFLNDVDGFKDSNKIINDDYSNIPATPKGIMEHLEYTGCDLRGKTVVIVGRGKLVGKPLSILMINKGATVITLNSKSNILVREMSLHNADVVICATGIKGSVKSSELSNHKQVLVYNVGTCFDDDGRLTTELDVNIDKPNVFYTDRIGAVGVCTVLSLLDNVVKSY